MEKADKNTFDQIDPDGVIKEKNKVRRMKMLRKAGERAKARIESHSGVPPVAPEVKVSPDKTPTDASGSVRTRGDVEMDKRFNS